MSKVFFNEELKQFLDQAAKTVKLKIKQSYNDALEQERARKKMIQEQYYFEVGDGVRDELAAALYGVPLPLVETIYSPRQILLESYKVTEYGVDLAYLLAKKNPFEVALPPLLEELVAKINNCLIVYRRQLIQKATYPKIVNDFLVREAMDAGYNVRIIIPIKLNPTP